MQAKPTAEQLEKLCSIVAVVFPACLYSFLVQFQIVDLGRKMGVIHDTASFAAIAFEQWPEDVKADYRGLWDTVPHDMLQNISAEIYYCIIFWVAACAVPYVDLESQAEMLDALFGEAFRGETPWDAKFPAADAFTKYRQSKNPLLVFSNSLSLVTGVRDALDLMKLTTSVMDLIQDLVPQEVEKVFKKDEPSGGEADHSLRKVAGDVEIEKLREVGQMDHLFRGGF